VTGIDESTGEPVGDGRHPQQLAHCATSGHEPRRFLVCGHGRTDYEALARSGRRTG
jgi:hypothetical protein